MSSAWDSDDLSMAPVVLPGLSSVETEANQTDDDDALEPDPSMDAAVLEEEYLPEPLAYLGNVQYLPTRRPLGGKTGDVLGKMKKLGDKVKRLLRGKLKSDEEHRGGVNIDVDVRRVGRAGNSPLPDVLSDVVAIENQASAAQVYDSLLSSHGTDCNLPLPLPPPPGLLVRRQKARPSLSPQTYSSNLTSIRANEHTTGQNATTIQLQSCSSSGGRIADTITPKNPSPDLTVHSRPKTLAEIKSKRRLSLSALSNFARSPSLAPPVNIVTSSHRRARPASALAFYPRPPPLAGLRTTAQTNGPTATVRSRPATSITSTHRTPSTAPLLGTLHSGSVAASASMTLPRENQPQPDSIKKKNRRFSLSALSNFAAGHWDEGAWQRSGALRTREEV
ncbi:hypothetical protein B0H10DRAFT_441863 [Mycena sp. CBHHK59/15]|nr:hypothetical protein B0H10DRAFT_441863 [Mycena sp. CBHHK59/15]